MPAGKGLGLHDAQGVPPVEPATEPDAGEAHGIGGAPRLDASLLIQGELLAEKEILRSKNRTGAQAEKQKAHSITHKRETPARK